MHVFYSNAIIGRSYIKAFVIQVCCYFKDRLLGSAVSLTMLLLIISRHHKYKSVINRRSLSLKMYSEHSKCLVCCSKGTVSAVMPEHSAPRPWERYPLSEYAHWWEKKSHWGRVTSFPCIAICRFVQRPSTELMPRKLPSAWNKKEAGATVWTSEAVNIHEAIHLTWFSVGRGLWGEICSTREWMSMNVLGGIYPTWFLVPKS